MIEVVQMAKKHIEQVAKLEKNVFNIPWSKKMFEDELKNALAIYVVAVDGERVVGYGGLWHVINEGHITNIAVLPEYRRQGVATMIIDKISQLAIEKEMIGLTLEVRTSNFPAKKLYTKLGFKLEGIRKEYYSDTKEDALIMWKYFIDESLID